jgi:GNAT superfamily N-acetyltransferase
LGAENSNGNDDLPPRLVAISCHYDVEDWLDPDWVFDVAECSFQWRRRRRHPEIRMRVWETPRSTWKLFRRHHYLNHEIPNNAKCYVAEWDGVPVAFCAVVHQMHQSNGPLKFHRRCSRLVVDPDYQGLGFGPRLLNHIADLYRREDSGRRFTIRTSHPGLVHWLRRSRRWRVLDKANHVAAEGAKQGGRSESRLTQGFEYLLTRRK